MVNIKNTWIKYFIKKLHHHIFFSLIENLRLIIFLGIYY